MGAWTHLPSVKNPVSALGDSKARRDAEFTEYVTGRMAAWRRVGYLLCQDWDRADDLVQGAITKLYVGWNRVRAANHIDSYAHVVPGAGVPRRAAVGLVAAGRGGRAGARSTRAERGS